MISKELTVINKIGFHARPASMLVQAAKKYQCSITLAKNGQQTDLGSIVSLLKMRVKCGDEVILQAEGPDESAAIEDLVTLIESGFGEE